MLQLTAEVGCGCREGETGNNEALHTLNKYMCSVGLCHRDTIQLAQQWEVCSCVCMSDVCIYVSVLVYLLISSEASALSKFPEFFSYLIIMPSTSLQINSSTITCTAIISTYQHLERLSIRAICMQNGVRSQMSAVMISCHNICVFSPSVFPSNFSTPRLDLKTFKSFTAGVLGITVRITGITEGTAEG